MASSLSSVVSGLVRASMGSTVPNTVTDDDLDRHIGEIILREAKQKAERYKKDGIRAYLPTTDANVPRANKRFLSSIIRSTDDHNKAILRSQAVAAAELKEEREEQERRERRARADEAAQDRLRRLMSGGRRSAAEDRWRPDRDRDRGRERPRWEQEVERVREKSRSKSRERKRYWDEDEDDYRHRIRSRRRHREDDSRSDRRHRRRPDSPSRSRSPRKKREKSKRRSSSSDRRKSPEGIRSRQRRRHSSSRSRSPIRLQDKGNQSPTRSKISDDDSSLSLRRTPSRSHSPHDKPQPNLFVKATTPIPAPIVPPSRSLSATPGPPSRSPSPPPIASKMDKYFSPTYDPRLDVAPLASSSKLTIDVPATGLIDNAQFEGWDAMLELIRVRREDRAEKKRLERLGLLPEKEGGKEGRGKKGKGMVSAGDEDGKGIMEIEYKKKGAVREWDMGKEGF